VEPATLVIHAQRVSTAQIALDTVPEYALFVRIGAHQGIITILPVKARIVELSSPATVVVTGVMGTAGRIAEETKKEYVSCVMDGIHLAITA